MGKKMIVETLAALALFSALSGCGNGGEEMYGAERSAGLTGNQPPICGWSSATSYVTMSQNYFQWFCTDPDGDAIAGCTVGLDHAPSIVVSRFDYLWRDFLSGTHAFKVVCRDTRGAVSPELAWNFTYETPECTSGDSWACFTDDPTRRGIGICRDGVKHCVSGRWGSCEGEVRALGYDACSNHLDDDCDGQTDEGCAPISADSPDASSDDAGGSRDAVDARPDDAGTSSPDDVGVEAAAFTSCTLAASTTAPTPWSFCSNIESSWSCRTGSPEVIIYGVPTGREFAVNVEYGDGSQWAAVNCGISQWLIVNGVVLDLSDGNGRGGRNFYLTLNSDCSPHLRGNSDVCSGAPARPSTGGGSPDAGSDTGRPDADADAGGSSVDADSGSHDDSSSDSRDDGTTSDSSSSSDVSTFSVTVEIPEASFIICSCSSRSDWWNDQRYGTSATWSGVVPGPYDVNGQLRSGRWAAALPGEDLAVTFVNSVSVTAARSVPGVDGQNLIFLLDESGNVTNLGPDTGDFHIAGVASDTAIWFGNLLKGFAFGLWDGFLADLHSVVELGSCLIHPISCLRNVAAAASQLYAALRTEEFRNLMLQNAVGWGINFLDLPLDQQAFETGKIGGFLAEQIILFKIIAWGSGELLTADLPGSLRLLLDSEIISGDTNYLRSKLTEIYRALVRLDGAATAEGLFLDDTLEDGIVRIFKRTADPSGRYRFRIFNPTTGEEEFVDGTVVLKRGHLETPGVDTPHDWGWVHILQKHYDDFVRWFHLSGTEEENIRSIKDIISDVLEHGTRRADDLQVVEKEVTFNGRTMRVKVVVNNSFSEGSITTAYPVDPLHPVSD